MTREDGATESRYDHTRSAIFPIEVGIQRILEALVEACEAFGEEDGGRIIRCFASPEVEDGVVQEFWRFRCVYTGDATLMAQFKVMILISPDQSGLVLLITKMNLPDNDLGDDLYEMYAVHVRTLTGHLLLGREAQWYDTVDSIGLVNQCFGTISPQKVQWAHG